MSAFQLDMKIQTERTVPLVCGWRNLARKLRIFYTRIVSHNTKNTKDIKDKNYETYKKPCLLPVVP